MRRILATFLALAFFSSLSIAQAEKPLQQKSFDEIIQSYFFVDDFERKIPERDVSENLFWRYPYKIGSGSFDIIFDFENIEEEIPVTVGEGKPYHYLNSGRVAFYKGDYEKAKTIWVEGRNKFKTDYPYHRRLDYFIALAFLKLAQAEIESTPEGYKGEKAIAYLNNASTFYAWSLFKKEDIKDPLFNIVSAKQTYNLAAIYYRYKRYSASYGAASRGLDLLRMNGEQKYHTKLTRILAESFIQNRSYRDAIQSYDVTLRQSPSQLDAAAIFSRVGDIYFDLNNYEIAVLNYELADKIYRDNDIVDVRSLIFLAESLFWSGKVERANTTFRYALSYANSSRAKNLITKNTEAFARLRLADTYLALDKIKIAKGQFYEHARDFRDESSGKIAKIRSACMDLPEFEGNNIMHARETLQALKYDDVPPQARELAWACEVASYAQRERTVSMIDRVKVFLTQFPKSRFLKGLVKPVEDVRRAKLFTFLEEKNLYDALNYYNTHKKLLFMDLDRDTKTKLFRAAIDVSDLKTAELLYEDFNADKDPSELNILRKITYLSEVANDKNATKEQKKRPRDLAKVLQKRKWTLDRSVFTKNMLHRILDTESANQHLIWIYNLIQTWKIDSESITCTEQFPLMEKLYRFAELKPNLREQIKAKVAGLSSKLLPNLLRTDELCAIGLLNFEVAVNKDTPKILVNRYLGRLEWPISNELAAIYWNIAETAQSIGMKQEAIVLWQTIQSRAPKSAPQVSFATSRLESRKTEFEKLWE